MTNPSVDRRRVPQWGGWLAVVFVGVSVVIWFGLRGGPGVSQPTPVVSSPIQSVADPVSANGGPGAIPGRESLAEFTIVRVIEDATGRPLPGARFTRVPGRRSSYEASECIAMGAADANGIMHWAKSELPGVGGILVDGPNHLPEYLELGSLAPESEVRLRRGHMLIARCTTLDGSPLAGVMVGMLRSRLDPALPVPRRPGPDGSLPMAWMESDAAGIVSFPPLAEGTWRIEAMHPSHVMVGAPDYGAVRLPCDGCDLKFAPIYVCMANVDAALGPEVTHEYQLPSAPWRVDNTLASNYCAPLAADLRRRFGASIVAVSAVDSRYGLPEPLRGRIMTESGWFRFRADWRPLSEVGTPWVMETEASSPQLEWGEAEVFVVGVDGRPLDVGTDTSLVVGGPIPTVQIAYEIGTRRRLPVGSYRLDTPCQRFFSKAIANEVVVVRKGELTSRAICAPAGIALVQFNLQIAGSLTPSSGGIQVLHEDSWEYLGVWTPKRRSQFLPRGNLRVKAVAMGADEPVLLEISVADAGRPQVVTVDFPK